MARQTRIPNSKSLEYIRRNFVVIEDTVQRNDGYLGGLDREGYLRFKVPDFSDKKYPYQTIFAHHICWYLETGDWPESEIDHIDHNKRNNDIENLQILAGEGNSAKQIRNSWLPSGVKEKKGGYEVYIRIGGRQMYCGWFNNALDAGEWYRVLREKLDRGESVLGEDGRVRR